MFKNILKIFSKQQQKEEEKKELSPLEQVENELHKQYANLEEKESLEKKYFIYKKILSLLIKKKALLAQSSYIKKASTLVNEIFEDNLYEALLYLNGIDTSKFSKEYIYEIYSFQALLYEALEDFPEAAKSYKEAINLTQKEELLEEFQSYIQRYQKLLQWQKDSKDKIVLDDLYTIHERVAIEDLPKSATSLENIALYYAKSPKSRALGKRYFKEVLKIYKKLYEHNPQEFSCSYIKALMDGVELFMLTPLLLKEVQKLLERPNLCLKNRVYLLERLKELKEKSFIKKSRYYSDIFS